MDALKTGSIQAVQGYGMGQAPLQKNEQAEKSVSAITTATDETQANTPEPHAQEHKQKVSNAVKEISSFFQMAQSSLQFSLDEVSGRMVMQIKDNETNKVIRQIPSEDVLKLAERLDDVDGLIFKAKA